MRRSPNRSGLRRRLGRNALIYAVLAIGAIWLVGSFVGRGTQPTKLRFDQFLDKVEAEEVATAEMYLRDQRIRGDLRNGTNYETTYAGDGDRLADRLARNDVKVTPDPQGQSVFLTFLTNVLPLLLIFGFFFLVMNQAQGGGSRVMSFGRAKPRLVTKEMPKIGFDDVAGLDEAVEEIVEIKEYLSNPSRFQAIGAKIPKGVLLFGPPGTGKTLLARAVAGEAGVPFFSISGSDFVEMFVGVGAARVRDLFEQAKTAAPAIVFVDEIDAVGRHRGAGLGGGHDEREQTLNQLLVEMDGFDVKTGVVLIAATNRPDILDPALLRPGRFDRHIVVDRPDIRGREGILKVHAKGKPMAEGVDLGIIARRTPGFTGADLANVVNESALLAARRSKEQITGTELEEAIDRVIAGPEHRSRLITAEEKRIIAYHEAGHALVSHLLPYAHPVHKITIVARGRALGFTLTLPTEDRYLVTKAELTDELAMILGGRAAEELVFGDVTTGAQDDIDRSSKIARAMVCEYGMSSLGPLALGQRHDQPFLGRDIQSVPDYSDTVAAEIDAEIRKIVETAFEEAKTILRSNRANLDLIAERLIEQETIEAPQLEELLSGLPVTKGERGKVLTEPRVAGGKKAPSGRRLRAKPRPKPEPGLSPA
ncbi:MAG TPA: ATP-dependent zinc metalloprotease FtsH [Actinomycetota bacterium]|jgi:cell division protease FtsH|nr:ATP-dependent zinc metalloprotease FtsH [Actinomycetota bacterium]